MAGSSAWVSSPSEGRNLATDAAGEQLQSVRSEWPDAVSTAMARRPIAASLPGDPYSPRYVSILVGANAIHALGNQKQ